VLKTIGLMVLMSYHGIPLPADAGTTIPRLDNLWCHIGDEQDVTADLSTFSGAMAATARLLAEAGAGTLVLYDELGAGTDPLEGAALGCALLEEVTARGALTVATTHLAAVAMAASTAAGDSPPSNAPAPESAAGPQAAVRTIATRAGAPKTRGKTGMKRIGPPPKHRCSPSRAAGAVDPHSPRTATGPGATCLAPGAAPSCCGPRTQPFQPI